MIYKVLKPFFKASLKQNYSIDETIDLSKEDALGMLKEGYIEETKSKEVTPKDVIETPKEIVGFKVSTNANEGEILQLPKVKKQ